jgi:hypothetical protein
MINGKLKEEVMVSSRILYDRLNLAYSQIDASWIQKNYFPINTAHKFGVIICGSVGAAIATGTSKKVPNDIDFVATDLESALTFMNSLHIKMSKYKQYYKVLYNNRTKFCPDGCTAHIRLHAPMWLPICIFVVPTAKSWKYLGRWLIQDSKQIQLAANDMTHRDGFPRKYFPESIDVDGLIESNDDDGLIESISFTHETKRKYKHKSCDILPEIKRK